MSSSKQGSIFSLNSIKKKMILGFLSVILINLIAFLGLEIFNSYKQMKEEALDKSYAYAEHIEKVVSPIGIEQTEKLQEKIKELLEQYPLVDSIGIVNDKLGYVANTNKGLVGQSFNNEYTKDLISNNKALSFSLEENSDDSYYSAVPLYKTGSTSFAGAADAVSSATTSQESGTDGVAAASAKVNISGLVIVKMDNEAMLQGLKEKIVDISIISIIVFLVSIGIAVIISLSITKPLVKIRDYLKEMALGDLTQEINIRSKDELKDLSLNISSTNGSLRKMISNIKVVSKDIEEYSKELKLSSEGVASASEEISSTMNSVADSTSVQNDNLSEAMNKLKELANSLEEISLEINTMEKESTSIRSMADDGTEKINYVVKSMEDMRESFEEMSSGIKVLDDNIIEINSISETINNVAKQTNLLSLNAAIEASRANEAGNGFAVVANEVKKLAEQTLESSEIIAKLIKNISNNSKIVSDTAMKSIDKFEEQSEIISNTIVAFDTIVNQINVVIPKINNVSTIIKNTNTIKDKVMNNVQNISSESEELSASVEEITQSVEEQSATIVDLSGLSDRLHETARDMIEAVKHFKI
ncbi:methyl-accepting chemotaxis protein [Clostridium intestinale]|uniref:methyl-accepting chemotaxis protein n=1 Tax=Clostridium intestinale TaxID=36845 RepID=UPI0028EADB95|nr:methyl-accepting chemotaxis protein [Clostridium intestinale]